MDRKLGKFESAPAIANDFASFSLVGVLEIENAPSEEVIRASLDTLQKHHPALRTRITAKGKSYAFESSEIPKIPLTVEERKEENLWVSSVESHLNNSVAWRTGPLLECTYLKNHDPMGVSEIIFSFHHSIVDANSLVSFLNDFLTLCASSQSGHLSNGFEGYPAFSPVEELFPSPYKGVKMMFKTASYMMRQMASEMSIMMQTAGKRKPPIEVHSVSKVLSMHLSEHETEVLERTARRHKVTLNSVQHAAILTATWKHLYKRETMPVKYILFQNLRPYLVPPLSKDVLGSYIAMIQLVTKMDKNRNFWDLCQEINQAVFQAGKSGEKFISANMAGLFIKMLFRFKAFRIAVTALNYSGPVSLQETYGDMRVVGVRGFVSNFGLGPEFSAQTLMFKGKLFWNLLYLETDMNEETAKMIADEIKGLLVSKALED
jgi:hypothetical protein